MNLEEARKLAANTYAEAEAAKEAKQSLEKELLEEIPIYKAAKTNLTKANAAHKEAEAAYREALSSVYQLTGKLPEDKFALVSVRTNEVLTNEATVIRNLISATYLDAYEYLTLKGLLSHEEIVELGGVFDRQDSLVAQIQWKELVRNGDNK